MTEPEVLCPKCQGRMWDNRLTKRNSKAPDFKCRDRSCDGVVWPPKDGAAPRAAAPAPAANQKQGFTAGGPIAGLDPEPMASGAEVKAEQWKHLLALHKKCLQFVLTEEAPLLAAAQVGDSPEAVSARTAQLFIAATGAGLHR